MPPSTRVHRKQQQQQHQQPSLDDAAPSGLFLDVNDPAVEAFIEHMEKQYRSTWKEFVTPLFAQVGLPPDALELRMKEQKQGKHSRTDNGKPAAAASTDDCQSPVRKKQKSDSPVAAAAAAAETPALEAPVLSEKELSRIRGCNKKQLCAELKALGADHHMSWKKNDLIAELIATKQAPPMPATQPAGFSKYAALDNKMNSTAGGLRSAVQSPSKVSNDDSAAAGAASKKQQTKASAAASKNKPAEELPPVGSVKRAIMEREALAGKKPDPSVAAPKPAGKKKAAPKSPPPPTPQQQPPAVDEDFTITMDDESEADVASPTRKEKSDAAPKEPVQDESMMEDDVDSKKEEQQFAATKATAPASPPASPPATPAPPLKEAIVDSDEMEVEPESDAKPAAAPTNQKDEAESAGFPETQEFEDTRMDLTESQEESQRKRRKNAVKARYVPGLPTVPGSTNKATPNGKKIDCVQPGTVKSMTKKMQEKESAKKLLAPTTRTLFLPEPLAYAETDKTKAATTGGKVTRSKPAATTASSIKTAEREDAKKKKIQEMRAKSKQQIQAGATKTTGSADHFAKQYASASKLGARSGKEAPSMVSRVREKAQKQQQQETAASSKTKMLPPMQPPKKKDLLPATKHRAVKPALFAGKKFSPYHHKSPSKPPKTHEKEQEEDDNPYDLPDVVCYPEDTYVMTDTEASDYEPDSDEEYHHRIQKKKPKWAKSENLKNALDLQYAPDFPIDPDVLFGEVETCDLVAMFGVTDPKHREKLKRRRSSGRWENDRLTSKEKEDYKLAIRAGVACAL